MRKAYKIEVSNMPLDMHIYNDNESNFVFKSYVKKRKNKFETVSNDIQTQVTASYLLNSFNKLLKSNRLNQFAKFK